MREEVVRAREVEERQEKREMRGEQEGEATDEVEVGSGGTTGEQQVGA